MHALPRPTSLDAFLAHRARFLLKGGLWALGVAALGTIATDAAVGLDLPRLVARVLEFLVAALLLRQGRRDSGRWQDWLIAACSWLAATDAYGNASLLEPAAASTASAFLAIGLGLFPVAFRAGLPRFALVAAASVVGLMLGGITDFGTLLVPVLSAGLGLSLAHIQYTMVAESWTLREAAIAASEEAERAAQAKARFLGGVSHDMRTPLHGLFGMIDEVKLGPLSPAQSVAIHRAEHAAEQLSMLVEDALALAEDRQHLLTLRLEPTFPMVPLRSALAMVRGRPTVEIGHLPEAPILTDPRRLQQLLYSLLPSAAEEDIADATRIRVDWTEDRLAFEVTTPAPRHAAEGDGLETRLVQTIIDAMAGSFTRSLDDSGRTRTRVEIPAALATAASLQTSRETGGARVLVVDDNALNRTVLQRMLQTMGITAVVAEDGAEALDRLTTEVFTLVLMDLDMPIMDGLTATRAARERGLSMPIVAVTASATSETPRCCAEAGMDGLIIKPARPADILAVVHAALESASAA